MSNVTVAIEPQIVQPGDRRQIDFIFKRGGVNYSLESVTDLILKRYGPLGAELTETILGGGLLAVNGNKLSLIPDETYWGDFEGLYRFSTIIGDPNDPLKFWFMPSDPRKMSTVRLINPASVLV